MFDDFLLSYRARSESTATEATRAGSSAATTSLKYDLKNTSHCTNTEISDFYFLPSFKAKKEKAIWT